MIEAYGASDDLIEVEGHISEEFDAWDDGAGYYLGFSDSTIVHFSYVRGCWRIEPIVFGDAFIKIDQCPANDDKNYSDRLYLGDNVRWVVLGDNYAIAGQRVANI